MHIDIEPLFKIIIYSHFFKITNLKAKGIQLALKFSIKYVQMGYVREAKGKQSYKPIKVFASKVGNNEEFRFHIGQLKEFYYMLDLNYITKDLYEIEYAEYYKEATIKMNVRKGFELRDYQIEAQDFILKEDPDDNRSRLVSLRTGLGKAQPLDALIKIPNGWTNMGNIKVGDIITAKDGTDTIITGTYPQGNKNIFKITFADGRSAECTIDHLWKVYFSIGDCYYKVVSVRQLLDLFHRSKRFQTRSYIDLINPAITKDIDLPLDPYVLGVFLGDGYLSKVTNISTPDEFVLEEIRNKLPNDLYIKHLGKYDYGICKRNNKFRTNSYTQIFRNLGLSGKLSYEKFIPEIYFNGSIEQRLALVQGLMDSDGTISNDHISFCSTSIKLIEGLQYLIRSLGGIAKLTSRYTYYTHNDEKRKGRLSYRLSIRFKIPDSLFRLPRKKDKAKHTNQYSDGLKLRIEKIEHIGNKEAQCISIDHPDKLYVTNDFISTHNTSVSLSAVSKLNTRVIIIILASYIDKWCGDITDLLDVKEKEIMPIQGTGQLKGLISLAKDDELTSKFIVISLSTIKNFFKTYEKFGKDYTIDEYGCIPEELFEITQSGVMIIDEVHQHLHGVFKLLSYTHIKKVIALSATFISDDLAITNIQKLMFPKEIRFDKIVMENYTIVRAVGFNFDKASLPRIKTTQFKSNTYSHVEVEKSILKYKYMLDNYIRLIDSIIEVGYIYDYKPGDKLAIFCSSINMCNEITKYLKNKYKRFDIRRYVEDDPYENVIEPDIRVTTILSAGTAIDIPGLRTVIMTTSISSPVANIQTMGRLRKLKDKDVYFYYLYAENIPKQKEYHERKLDLFRDRVKSIKELKSNIIV